jgi:hypothetical protein
MVEHQVIEVRATGFIPSLALSESMYVVLTPSARNTDREVIG